MKGFLLPAVVSIVCVSLANAADADKPAGSTEWQILKAEAGGQPAGATQKRACQIKVPASWKLKEKSATSDDQYGATLVLEVEKPESWWNKRKAVDFKEQRKYQDSRTSYWIEVVGALLSDKEEGATHIIGVRDGDLVCHALLELKSADFEEKYPDTVREMGLSLKPVQ